MRVGNQAHEHLQHDVYGQIVLPLVQAFFDQRLLRPGTLDDFHALEKVGERAFAMHDQPDAGLWEFRTIARVHTYSSVMCWAACDRLAKAARQAGPGRSRGPLDRAGADHPRRGSRPKPCFPRKGRFAASFGGTELDASLLQLVDLGFLDAERPASGRHLRRDRADLKKGPYLFRYVEPDDFGEPETAFNFCTFWFIEALHQNGRDEEAREMFEEMLSRRTHAGLLREDIVAGRQRALGKLSADLFPGRPHQLRGAAEPIMDGCAMSRTAKDVLTDLRLIVLLHCNVKFDHE